MTNKNLKIWDDTIYFGRDMAKFVSLQLATQICSCVIYAIFIQIPFIKFCQVGLEMLGTKFRADRLHGLGGVRKSRFAINRDFSRINVQAEISGDSSEFRECVDMCILMCDVRFGSYKAKHLFLLQRHLVVEVAEFFLAEVPAGIWTSPENGTPSPCTVQAVASVLSAEK